MPLHSDWYDIVGLSVIGPPPLGEIHLPWQRGLHVVYGRNGAGKTRLLEAISSLSPRVEALEGGTAFVHLVYDSDAAFRPDAENHLPHELLAWDLCDSALERYFEGVAFERDSIDQGTLDFLQFDWRDTTLGEVVRTVARVPGMVLDHDSLILDETLSANALSISSGGPCGFPRRLDLTPLEFERLWRQGMMNLRVGVGPIRASGGLFGRLAVSGTDWSTPGPRNGCRCSQYLCFRLAVYGNSMAP